MNARKCNLLVCTATTLFAIASSCHAAILSVGVSSDGNMDNLDSVTLTMPGGRPDRTVSASGFTRITVTDFLSVTDPEAHVLLTPDPLPPAGSRASLMRDLALNTGVINPSDTAIGLTVAFDAPVTNGPGIDVLFFEFTGNATVGGDPFIVRRLDGTHPLTVTSYDIAQTSPHQPTTYRVSRGANSTVEMAELESGAGITSEALAGGKFTGVGIDLSDLGYAPGETITGLQFLATSSSLIVAVDPTLIVGLPPSGPRVSIRVSEVEVCWDALSNRTYQLQYRAQFDTNDWADLGVPIPGTVTNCIYDRVLRGQQRRFYRVLELP